MSEPILFRRFRITKVSPKSMVQERLCQSEQKTEDKKISDCLLFPTVGESGSRRGNRLGLQSRGLMKATAAVHQRLLGSFLA